LGLAMRYAIGRAEPLGSMAMTANCKGPRLKCEGAGCGIHCRSRLLSSSGPQRFAAAVRSTRSLRWPRRVRLRRANPSKSFLRRPGRDAPKLRVPVICLVGNYYALSVIGTLIGKPPKQRPPHIRDVRRPVPGGTRGHPSPHGRRRGTGNDSRSPTFSRSPPCRRSCGALQRPSPGRCRT
jgi:hypothetical protein